MTESSVTTPGPDIVWHLVAARPSTLATTSQNELETVTTLLRELAAPAVRSEGIGVPLGSLMRTGAPIADRVPGRATLAQVHEKRSA